MGNKYGRNEKNRKINSSYENEHEAPNGKNLFWQWFQKHIKEAFVLLMLLIMVVGKLYLDNRELREAIPEKYVSQEIYHDKIESLEKDISTIKDDVKNQTDDLNNIYRLLALNALTPKESTRTNGTTMAYNSNLRIEPNMVFVNSGGEEFVSNDLIGDTVLLTYYEDGKEVYFLGQFNSGYHWEGYCVTNSYNSDGTLDGICESNFDDGERLDYISLYRPSDSEDFYYGNRKIENGVNVGVTKHYRFNNSEVKDFTKTNVRATDIRLVEEFLSKQADLLMTEYYNGKTSNNAFNDETGNAYRLTFNDDGKVISLYHGKFKNGNANDDSSDAYSIIYSQQDDGYYYNNNTTFTDGYADIKSTHKLTENELNDLVSKIEIDGLNLTWIGIESIADI